MGLAMGFYWQGEYNGRATLTNAGDHVLLSITRCVAFSARQQLVFYLARSCGNASIC